MAVTQVVSSNNPFQSSFSNLTLNRWQRWRLLPDLQRIKHGQGNLQLLPPIRHTTDCGLRDFHPIIHIWHRWWIWAQAKSLG